MISLRVFNPACCRSLSILLKPDFLRESSKFDMCDRGESNMHYAV